MAFDSRSFQKVSGPRLGASEVTGVPMAPEMFAYSTNDTAATVDTAGYFNAVSTDVAVGDVIYVAADLDGTPAFGWMVVNSNTGGVVDVTDLVVAGSTDTD